MECIPGPAITSTTGRIVIFVLVTQIMLGTYGYADKCPKNANATTNSQFILSDGFGIGRKYSNDLECGWRITSTATNRKVKIVIRDFDVEYDADCRFDYLEIFDGYDDTYMTFGRFCGTEGFIIVSSGISLYFVFSTDHAVNKDGFKIRYFTVDSSVPSTQPRDDDSYDDSSYDDDELHPQMKNKDKKPSPVLVSAVVGGGLGGMCVVIIIIAVCCMCSTRICRHCNRASNGRQRTSVSPHSSDVEIGSRRQRVRRTSPVQAPVQVSPYLPRPYRNTNNNTSVWTTNQHPECFPMEPINPPPYRETENYPASLCYSPAIEVNPFSPPSSPPPSYSFGLSSDSNPPAYEDDRHSPPNYIAEEDYVNPPRTHQ